MKSSFPQKFRPYDDPRRRSLQLSARAVYYELVWFAVALGSPSIRRATTIPDAQELAKIVGCTLIELADGLHVLESEGLIVHCLDGAISLPALRGYFDRRAVNMANGKRGGRPRKSTFEPGRK